MNPTRLTLMIALALSAIVITARAADAEGAKTTFEVTITNLTESQVLSPPILIAHGADQSVWAVGETASDAVLDIAEMGDTSGLAEAATDFATSISALDAPIPPGASVSATVMAADGDVLSSLAMLVQTNDAITGLSGHALGDAASVETGAYDAGTEENTEAASDVPGPPFGGTNRAPTEPRAAIAPHGGIGGAADVGAEYDWEGAVAKFEIRALPVAMPKTGGGGAAAHGSFQPVILFLLGIAALAVATLRRRAHRQLL